MPVPVQQRVCVVDGVVHQQRGEDDVAKTHTDEPAIRAEDKLNETNQDSRATETDNKYPSVIELTTQIIWRTRQKSPGQKEGAQQEYEIYHENASQDVQDDDRVGFGRLLSRLLVGHHRGVVDGNCKIGGDDAGEHL